MDENGKAGVSARSFLNIQKEDKKMIRSLSQAGGRRYIQLKKMVSFLEKNVRFYWNILRWITCSKTLMEHRQLWNSSLVMDVGVLLMEKILCWLREASQLTLSTGKLSLSIEYT